MVPHILQPASLLVVSLLTVGSSCTQGEDLYSPEADKADQGDGFSTIVHKDSPWIDLEGTSHSGESVLVERIGNRTVVKTDLVSFFGAESIDINLEQTNTFFTAPGMRFSLAYKTAGSDEKFTYTGWKVPRSQSGEILSTTDGGFYNCFFNHTAGELGSRAFKSIRTNYPTIGQATIEVGVGCPVGDLETKIVSMTDFDGLADAANNEFVVLAFPVDVGLDKADPEDYGYTLDVLCDRSECN